MYKFYWCLALLCLPSIARTQITLSGIVKDSLSSAPLPYTIIQTTGKVLAISGSDGTFHLSCLPGDTIRFTQLGYKTTALIRLRSESNMQVLMSESSTLLKAVTFFGNYKPVGKARWREYIILPSFYQNPTMKDSVGMIQTFGPGVIIPGALSYFTRYERNRRKLKRVLADDAATAVYREVITSEKVKQDITKMFLINDETYFSKIEKFNLTYPDAEYMKDRQEIINMLIQFFALK